MAPHRLSSTDVQRKLGPTMDRVSVGKETVIVEVHGRPRLVMLPVDEYDALIEAKRNWDFMRLRAIE